MKGSVNKLESREAGVIAGHPRHSQEIHRSAGGLRLRSSPATSCRVSSPSTDPSAAAREPICATIAGTRLELIVSGAARLDALLALIDGARSSIRLLFYMYASDLAGTRVRDALVAAARRGVRVQVLLDGYGCADLPGDFFHPLRDGGGHYCLFHPKYGRRYLLRNHQKLVIADDCKALVGGANIVDEYLTDAGDRHWRDLWLALDGQAVPAAASYFDALYRWTERRRPRMRSLRRLVHRHSGHQGPLQWKFSAPMSLRSPWPGGLVRELASARRLDIIAAYFSPPRSMLRRLGRLARRGTVRVITAARSDNGATIDAARHTYTRLLRRGVAMHEYLPAKLHSKLMIVDEAVYIGSANFDFRSLYINMEIMLRIEDPGFTAAMRGYFDAELVDSEAITPELHRQRATMWRRVKWTLSHWLVTSMDYTVTRRLNFRSEG
jgi:cardiolipin synthase